MKVNKDKKLHNIYNCTGWGYVAEIFDNDIAVFCEIDTISTGNVFMFSKREMVYHL